ncbi:hypothetical protein N7491_010205 [Penicillium cf. griseofulvum]|uniref:Tim44-like domain-containing protein n=1 Tax=Penicillium cf. griseofulvum TaxID=2972120 RepID=A0A9W9N0C4_9EURO|nr:hypothetical protein N7472_000537 [Penicillium cf. griseofulvum]KAJ5421760.1 hypothetical protein N7491_010205 [Penicillium cf. griseofulvum]KAJ5427952.1 hypothetical protein N7445_009406 [Penicillium cf. griseofulvum]
MASTVRLPAGTSARIIPSGSFVQCRAFSETSQQWRGRPMNFRSPSQAQPSFNTRTQGMKLSDLPTDIGILPGTFVRPLWRDMPSVFKAPRDRWHMEWTWLKSWVTNYGSLLQYCKRDNNLPLLLSKRRHFGAKLQEDMYTAFANGNIPKIRQICCDGLAKQLTTGIERRPKNELVTWKLVKYLRQPSTNFTGLRVISDRATSIPEVPKSGIRQVIVRITSRQSTTTQVQDPSGKESAEATTVSSKEQDCVEHIVIQNMRWNNQDKGWRVWGHINPTTLHEAMTNPSFMPGLSAAERLEMMKDAMGKN